MASEISTSESVAPEGQPVPVWMAQRLRRSGGVLELGSVLRKHERAVNLAVQRLAPVQAIWGRYLTSPSRGETEPMPLAIGVHAARASEEDAPSQTVPLSSTVSEAAVASPPSTIAASSWVQRLHRDRLAAGVLDPARVERTVYRMPVRAEERLVARSSWAAEPAPLTAPGAPSLRARPTVAEGERSVAPRVDSLEAPPRDPGLDQLGSMPVVPASAFTGSSGLAAARDAAATAVFRRAGEGWAPIARETADAMGERREGSTARAETQGMTERPGTFIAQAFIAEAARDSRHPTPGEALLRSTRVINPSESAAPPRVQPLRGDRFGPDQRVSERGVERSASPPPPTNGTGSLGGASAERASPPLVARETQVSQHPTPQPALFRSTRVPIPSAAPALARKSVRHGTDALDPARDVMRGDVRSARQEPLVVERAAAVQAHLSAPSLIFRSASPAPGAASSPGEQHAPASTAALVQRAPAGASESRSLSPSSEPYAGAAQPDATAASAPGAELDSIVQRVVRVLVRRLEVERERRGVKSWP